MQALLARLLLFFFLSVLTLNTYAKGLQDTYLVRCASTCAAIIQEITKSGGSVSYEFKNISALSARLNKLASENLVKLLGSQAISKDIMLKIPPPKDMHRKNIYKGSARSLSQKQLKTIIHRGKKDYLFNNAQNGTLRAHQQGQLGEGTIVAIIDTGTANNAELVPALAGSVIGGENFVPGVEEPSATSTLNDEHGTWVASMVAAHSLFVLPANDELIQSLQVHAADSLIPMENGEFGIAMIGIAPAAKIYALKTFAADGDGAPQSRVLAAMDRAISLKKNFNDGKASIPVAGDGTEDNPYVYDSLNIQVVNMSLGGPTLNPGYDLEDRLTLAMTQAGIVIVSSAGNEGPGAITVGSPATGYGSISVGAASNAINERVLRDLQFGLGTGLEFRPHNDIQLAYFSSRGPNADGRRGPDIVSNGYGTFVQGPQGFLDFISGTSLSSPTIAGAAALLFAAEPEAHPKQIIESLLSTANPSVMVGKLSPFDQGKGFLNVHKALNKIRDISGDDEQENQREGVRLSRQPEPSSVFQTLKSKVEIHDLAHEEFEGEVELVPGEIQQVFFNLPARIGEIELNIESVETELPPEKQNPIFGDDLLISLLDAPLSYNHVLMEDFVSQAGKFQFLEPQPGIMRLAIVGDWTNVGKVKAKYSLSAKARKLRKLPLRASIKDQETQVITLNVEPTTANLDLELRWKTNWTMNPSFDLDVILISPSGELYFDGASLHSPERVMIANPEPGEWTVIVEGYELHGFRDQYQLGAFDQAGKAIPLTP